MSWLNTETDSLLVLTRGVHIAASALVAGCLAFDSAVVEPALRSSTPVFTAVHSRVLALTWAALVIAVLTGLAWLTLVTSSMTDLAFGEAWRAGEVSAVVRQTQFGAVFEVRAVLVLVLAICLLFDRFVLSRWLGLGVGLALVAAIAWTGHAGSTLGTFGGLPLGSDVIHLCAAAAWLGGLAGLVIIFLVGRQYQSVECRPLQFEAVTRFSLLGIVSVIALTLSGFVNAWFLVGSFSVLFATDYGRLLLVKLFVFAAMLGLATANKLYFTPRLAFVADAEVSNFALFSLTRNAQIELGLGLAIFVIVGLLGSMHPAAHFIHPATAPIECGASVSSRCQSAAFAGSAAPGRTDYRSRSTIDGAVGSAV